MLGESPRSYFFRPAGAGAERGAEAHCPLVKGAARRPAVCRRGDGTAIGSGPRARPGEALPRSRSRGFDPAASALADSDGGSSGFWDGYARPSDGAAADDRAAGRSASGRDAQFG